MAEIRVSATDFRVHLKDLANHVAESSDCVVMERHGQRMAVLVSWEDYQFLLQNKPGKKRRADPLEHPREMPLEKVQQIYAETAESKDPAVIDWRGKALMTIWVRTGTIPRPRPQAPC